MKKILLFLLLLADIAQAQTPQTSYVVTSIATMKTYFGAANRVHITATNQDFKQCTSCTADEVYIFAGAGGRKWMKVTDSTRTTASAIHDSLNAAVNLDTLRNSLTASSSPLLKVISANSALLRSLKFSGSGVDTTASNDSTIAIAISGGGSGDMVLASAQTVTGAKTFNDTKFLLRNVANTFNGSFVNSNTADRIYTLPNAAGTVALTSDLSSGYQPLDADLTYLAGFTPTANVKTILNAADYAAIKTALGLTIGTDVQAYDADLTTIAGLTATTNNFIVGVSSAWASRTPAQVRTTLALTIGTDVQAYDADLTTWAGVTPGSGVGTFLATPSSANLATAVTGETGSGALVFGTSPDFTTGATIGSVAIPTISSTNTLTNKRWTARVGNTTSSATPTINTDNTDIYKLTAQTADITSMTTNLSGTPVDGDILEIQITGTAARAITWGASFVASTVALPTTTVTTATLTVIFQYYTTSSYGNNKWTCVNSY